MKNTKHISVSEMENQYRYQELINQINTSKKLDYNRPMYAYADTYGCQQNIADTEKIMGMMTDMGYTLTREKEKADIIVINTCAVREHAEEKVLGIIGEYKHLKAKNPNLIIAMCGCMIQQEHMVERIKKSYTHVDLLFGTKASHRFPELLYKALDNKSRVFDISGEDLIAEGVSVVRDGTIKAFLSIMYGCNNFCTYCIVPYVRGRERSRLPDDIIKEFQELVSSGYKEITLLGQNVNSYGKDLDLNVDFADLLDMLSNLDGDFKIRFMTSHPKDANYKMIDTMAKNLKIAKQLHLPFQAGNDEVLKAMNRGYNVEKYKKLMEYAKEKMPNLVITSDVIVGFPGETDEQFEGTLELVKDIKFNALYTFIYSKRSGTPAAKFDDSTTKEQKNVRFSKLLDIQNEIALRHNLDTIGRVVSVIVEEKSRKFDDMYVGRTEGGRLVLVQNLDDSYIGNFLNVKIIDANMRSMIGEKANG